MRGRICVAVTLATFAGLGAQPLPASRPDVVILLTDQHRADALGSVGAADVHTPALDRLASEGVLFTRAFAATPQCSPARAALLTGRYPHRTGVMGNTGPETPGDARNDASVVPAGMSSELDRSVPTLGQVFAAAGYETAYFGKWHLGGTPGRYGFAEPGGTGGDKGLAERVVEYLRSRPASGSRKPLMLIVSYLNPHNIYGVLNDPPPPAAEMAAARLPANLIDDLSQKPRPQREYLEEDQGKPFVGAGPEVWRRYRAYYNGLVEIVDRQVGTILDYLHRSPTPPIIVFSADHGDHGGAHGLPYKGPAMYEEIVRVPLMVTWPGKIQSGRSDALVSGIDIMPTLCDLAGVPVPAGVDGVSLRPLLEQRATRVREMIFGEYYGKQNWRVPIRWLRTERWKYVRYLADGEELYDLAADPGELRNLAGAPDARPEQMRLARELDTWLEKTDDSFENLTRTDRAGRVLSGRRGW